MKMSTIKKRLLLASAVTSAVCLTPVAAQADEEFGANTPYYEDDAWYDVSEWFDGNDYNPTDEAIGRWDNETFEFSDNLTSSDNDTFLNLGRTDYGYASRTVDNDRWFYDYYDDGYSSWNDTTDWSTYSTYYDTDDDGLYEAYASYGDWDGDGVYEDFNYYTFDAATEADQQQMAQARDQQKQIKSQTAEVSGTVQKTKEVQVRNRAHLVAHVQTGDGQRMAVDMGPKESLKGIKQGDKVSVSGHPVKVGDKTVLVATKGQSGDQDLQINRNGREYQGTVNTTRSVEIRGKSHLLAKIDTKEGKSMLVDLGPSDDLKNKPSEGSNVTVRGVPVQVKDRVILMARQLEQDGKKTDINRQKRQTQQG